MCRILNRTVLTALFAAVAVLLFFVCAAWEDMGDYPQKIWLHRCNSIEKLNEMADMYPNVEVDVVYRGDGVLDVTHDLDTTFNLDVEEFFRHYASNEGRMWLDVKNLHGGNRDSVLAGLVSLTREYGVARERLIVESREWRQLEAFTRAGFYTSWYVPFGKPNRLDEREKEECIDAIEDVAGSGCVRAVSFPYWWYDEISDDMDAPVDLLTWKHRSSQFLFLLSGEGKRMLADPRLKVVLVKDKGDFHR